MPPVLQLNEQFGATSNYGNPIPLVQFARAMQGSATSFHSVGRFVPNHVESVPFRAEGFFAVSYTAADAQISNSLTEDVSFELDT